MLTKDVLEDRLREAREHIEALETRIDERDERIRVLEEEVEDARQDGDDRAGKAYITTRNIITRLNELCYDMGELEDLLS